MTSFTLYIASCLAEVLDSEEAVEKRREKNGGLETTGSGEPQCTEYTGLSRIKNPKINPGQSDTSKTVKYGSMETGCQK